MRAWSIDWRVYLAALLAILFLSGQPAQGAESYITGTGEAKRAIARVIENLRRSPDIHTLRITPREISMLIHGNIRTSDVDEWRVGYVRRFFLDFETVGGPTPRRAPDMVADVSTGFFPLESLPLDKVSEVAAKAVAYAKLEGEGAVESIEIARRVHLLPTQTYGDVRWTVYVTTSGESATVYADASGSIIGANLANTNRARTMNFLEDADWPKEGAIASLQAFIGSDRRIRDVTVYPKSVQVKADHKTVADQTQAYSWDLAGVTSSGFLSPLFPGTGKEPLFSITEVDLEPLPIVIAAAKKAWGNSNSNMHYAMLRRFAEGPGQPELRWTVSFNDIGESGEFAIFSRNGTIELNTKGEVKAANLPESRQPKRDWLQPTMTADMLAVVDREFGKGARFAEIMVNREAISLLAEVPNQPGTMRSYNFNDRGFSASSMMMPWDAEFRPERLFTMQDLDFFTAQKLEELVAKTHTRLVAGSDLSLNRYTFSIGQLMTPDGSYMVPSPDGKITLEIRFESANGFNGGRVTYSSTGEAFDTVMP